MKKSDKRKLNLAKKIVTSTIRKIEEVINGYLTSEYNDKINELISTNSDVYYHKNEFC